MIMLNQECDHCHEKVFIRKQVHDKNICLDCLDAFKFGHITIDTVDGHARTVEHRIDQNKRRCTSCGRTIPEDARFCPYCSRHFW